MLRHALVATALCAWTVPAAAQVAADAPPVIVTRGAGAIKRAPDQAWVSIAAETRAATPAEAQRLAAEAMISVQKSLAGAKLPTDAIKTTGYSLQPDMDYSGGRQRVRGYIARNQIEVRVDDLSRVGAVIDAAGSGGATSMAGLRFDLKDRAAVEREALTLAVQNALARARAMATGAGVSLGPIIRIEEHSEMRGIQTQTMMMRAGAAEAAPTPVSPGEIEVVADVQLSVRIGGR